MRSAPQVAALLFLCSVSIRQCAATEPVLTVPRAQTDATASHAVRAAQKKVLNFNNDGTNMASCKSPFNSVPGAPFTVATLQGAVAETKPLGVQTHLLAPGGCWVAWWDSKLSPPKAYDVWMKSTFAVNTTHLSPVQSMFTFVLDGGDLLGSFAKLARANGQRAAVSFRINDFQWCDGPPNNGAYGFMSQFWYEHRHDPDVMYRGNFNDTCCWEKKCPCSCYGGEASMALSNAAVMANRQGFMLEILELNPGIDFEVDLERWSYIFRPSAANSSQRHQLMTGLLRTVRHAMAPGARLGLRVPPSIAVLDELGVDLSALADDPAVKLDYATMGVSFFAFLASTSDFSKIRARVPPDFQLLFEVSELHKYYTINNKRVQQLLTAEQLTTVALDAYAMGADGISTFNFQYYRSAGIEPLYHVLPHLTDEAYLQRADQYWFWTGGSAPPMQCTVDGLPFSLGSGNKTLSVHITVPKGAPYAPVGLLRFKFDAIGNHSGAMGVTLNGEALKAVANTTRIFASPVRDVDHGKYAAFEVDTKLILSGVNHIDVTCTSCHLNPSPSPSPGPGPGMGYKLSHDAGGGGDGMRWKFPVGYEPSSTVTGTAKPGASLPECEQLCDADTLCKGIYHEAQPGADSCFALHELVVDGHTAHTGQSFTRVHRDVAARLSPHIDSHVETMDLMLPVARKAQYRSGDDGGRRVLEWNRQ